MPERYDTDHNKTKPDNPNNFSLESKRSWGTISKVLLKSKRTIIVSL